MLRKVFFSLVLIWTVSIQASQVQIRKYITTHFPPDLKISDAQIAQLAWACEHVRPTRDLAVRISEHDKFIEIGRALSRVYCAQLLRSGTRASYTRFVEAQLQAGSTDILSFASFRHLSAHMQKIKESDYYLLETAAILSAVSLSKPAAMLARDAMLQIPTNDKMDFLAMTLRNNSEIYPLLQDLLQNNDATKKLLYVLFPPQTNFRHMLYTEGGVGMFKYLRTMIRHGFVERNDLDLWYAYWVMNIAGFRGHVAQNGSLYLNESTAQSMQALYALVYKMLDTPNFDPLVPYLEYRAKQLGLDNISTPNRLFVTHIGCLLRLYNNKDGQKLWQSWQMLPVGKTAVLEAQFANSLMDAHEPVHLHVPAWLANALHSADGDLQTVILQMMPVYNQSVRLSQQSSVANNLSFEEFAMPHNVEKVLQGTKLRLSIANDGTLKLSA